MTILTEKQHQADFVDPLRSSSYMQDVRITDEQADGAWAYLKRHCPDAQELGQMLGVIA